MQLHATLTQSTLALIKHVCGALLPLLALRFDAFAELVEERAEFALIWPHNISLSAMISACDTIHGYIEAVRINHVIVVILFDLLLESLDEACLCWSRRVFDKLSHVKF